VSSRDVQITQAVQSFYERNPEAQGNPWPPHAEFVTACSLFAELQRDFPGEKMAIAAGRVWVPERDPEPPTGTLSMWINWHGRTLEDMAVIDAVPGGRAAGQAPQVASYDDLTYQAGTLYVTYEEFHSVDDALAKAGHWGPPGDRGPEYDVRRILGQPFYSEFVQSYRDARRAVREFTGHLGPAWSADLAQPGFKPDLQNYDQSTPGLCSVTSCVLSDDLATALPNRKTAIAAGRLLQVQRGPDGTAHLKTLVEDHVFLQLRDRNPADTVVIDATSDQAGLRHVPDEVVRLVLDPDNKARPPDFTYLSQPAVSFYDQLLKDGVVYQARTVFTSLEDALARGSNVRLRERYETLKIRIAHERHKAAKKDGARGPAGTEDNRQATALEPLRNLGRQVTQRLAGKGRPDGGRQAPEPGPGQRPGRPGQPPGRPGQGRGGGGLGRGGLGR
jgi:hypothetical protein